MLTQWIQQENQWLKITGQPQLKLTTHQDRQRVADWLDRALSPENLTHDGELSARAVEARYRELTQCAEELRAQDPQVQFYEFG